MAAADPTLALTVPGRLIYAPQQTHLVDGLPLNAAGRPTYGGTELGIKVACRTEHTEEFTPIAAEELGQPVGAIRGQQTFLLSFVLVQWDPDALKIMGFTYDTNSAGGYTGALNLHEAPRGRLTPLSPVLFAPDDPQHEAVVIHVPVPYLKGTRAMSFALNAPLEVGAALFALAGGVALFTIGKLENITL